MPTSADLLLDTSAALGLLSPANPTHRALRGRTDGSRLGMSGHAAYETYSVLTRLPVPLRLRAADAWALIRARFPASRYLDAQDSAEVLSEMARRAVVGGAVYDGLVAAAARAHDLLLISCDIRASATYAALGTRFELVS